MKRSPFVIALTVLYGVVLCVTIIMACVTYVTQWRREVDSSRQRYLEVYVQALERYGADHGSMPVVPRDAHIISNSGTCSYVCSALGRVVPCIDAQPVLIPGYMKELYRDSWGTKGDNDSAFYIRRTSTGTIEVGACNAFYGGPFVRETASVTGG